MLDFKASLAEWKAGGGFAKLAKAHGISRHQLKLKFIELLPGGKAEFHAIRTGGTAGGPKPLTKEGKPISVPGPVDDSQVPTWKGQGQWKVRHDLVPGEAVFIEPGTNEQYVRASEKEKADVLVPIVVKSIVTRADLMRHGKKVYDRPRTIMDTGLVNRLRKLATSSAAKRIRKEEKLIEKHEEKQAAKKVRRKNNGRS